MFQGHSAIAGEIGSIPVSRTTIVAGQSMFLGSLRNGVEDTWRILSGQRTTAGNCETGSSRREQVVLSENPRTWAAARFAALQKVSGGYIARRLVAATRPATPTPPKTPSAR